MLDGCGWIGTLVGYIYVMGRGGSPSGSEYAVVLSFDRRWLNKNVQYLT